MGENETAGSKESKPSAKEAAEAAAKESKICLSGSYLCSGVDPCDACLSAVATQVVSPALSALREREVTCEACSKVAGLALDAESVSTFVTVFTTARKALRDGLRSSLVQALEMQFQQQTTPAESSLTGRTESSSVTEPAGRPGEAGESAVSQASDETKQDEDDEVLIAARVEKKTKARGDKKASSGAKQNVDKKNGTGSPVNTSNATALESIK